MTAHEKKWFEFVNKNKLKFKNKQSIATLTESTYLLKWFDINFWRTEYHNRVKDLNINKPDNVWTFDIIHFPYVSHNNILRQPENDYAQRPKNLKPRVSVLFAYNAIGDYLQPFFVYPSQFGEDRGDEISDITEATNDCITPNGFVTCRIFENWLFKFFMPYVREQLQIRNGNMSSSAKIKQENMLLLFCGKLALVDKQILSLVNADNTNNNGLRLNFFTLANEALKPFSLLFKVLIICLHFKKLKFFKISIYLYYYRKICENVKLICS